jgi:aspartate aminotransferase
MLDVLTPDGAFYLLPKVRGITDDQAFAMELLNAGVATVPGSAFGAPGHLRLSFATDQESLVEGCRRLVAFLGGQS